MNGVEVLIRLVDASHPMMKIPGVCLACPENYNTEQGIYRLPGVMYGKPHWG
jgi:hypothetical protein